MVPEERSQQQKEWLKHNCYLLTQVQEYMEETALYRANWIWANPSRGIFEILAEYPRLTSSGMVCHCLTYCIQMTDPSTSANNL